MQTLSSQGILFKFRRVFLPPPSHLCQFLLFFSIRHSSGQESSEIIFIKKQNINAAMNTQFAGGFLAAPAHVDDSLLIGRGLSLNIHRLPVRFLCV